MSVANFSRWANVTGFGKRTESPKPNVSQTSLNSSASTYSLGEDNSSVSNGDFGTLIIVIMKAKNLHNRRAISKQNPYCSVRVAKHSDRTKAITRGGQAPLWDHETRFKLNADDDNRHLKLCVFDQNGSNTEIIGDALIPLKPAFDAPTSEGYDHWFPIHFNKRYVGEVYLEMTFYPKKKSSRRSSRRSSVISNAASATAAASASANASFTSLPPKNHSFSGSCTHIPHSSSATSGLSMGLGSTANRSTPALPAASIMPPSISSHQNLPPLPAPPPHACSSASSSIRHSESMPILTEDIIAVAPPSRSPSPSLAGNRRSARPLPKLPHEQLRTRELPALQQHTVAQEDIQRQINDGYEASLFERLKPSASQPYF